MNKNNQTNTLIVYHGSKNIIEKPIFGYGKNNNDYGIGFYLTKDPTLSKQWSVRSNSDGYSNQYKLDLTDLKIINLNDRTYPYLTWLAILLENREFNLINPLAIEAKEYILNHFLIEYKEADIIIGYRADNNYFSYAYDFLNGTISYKELVAALKLGHLGEQIVLKSKNAFNNLLFLGSEKVESKEWYAKMKKREADAYETYLSIDFHNKNKDNIYIYTILNEEIKINDICLF